MLSVSDTKKIGIKIASIKKSMVSANRKSSGTKKISRLSPGFHWRLPARNATAQPAAMPIGMLSRRSQGCLALERNSIAKKVSPISVHTR